MTPVRRRVPLVRATGLAAGLAIMLGAPAVVVAHGLSPVYQSPLPLAVYLAGAATTVGLSFVFVIARDMRAAPTQPGRIVSVPTWIRVAVRAIGLLGWAWIMAQAIAGGSSSAAVGSLFLWVFGWVGIAMISALAAPVWEWIDPFATLFDIGAWLARRLGVRGWTASPLPAGLRLWPAAAGFAFFVWLELVAVVGSDTLAVVLAGYTVLTLALMAQFGRDAWREQGETFSVWFRTLNRLAPFGVARASTRRSGRNNDDNDPDAVDPDAVDTDAVDARFVVRRPFASGLLEVRWEIPRIVLVALGTGSIIFDAMSQTVLFASVVGAPPLLARTLLLAVFLGVIVGAALVVARTVSPGAIGAGLVPISVGYLVAHYLTYLLIDGQRLVIAVSDPLQTGADLFGTAFFEPSGAWLPPGLVWTVQLVAVVGGHMLGAWAGHVTAQRDMEAMAHVRPARDRRHRKVPADLPPARNIRQREVPLAIVMIALTTLTLWSLGQAIVVEADGEGVRPVLTGRT